jgi:hypothetical protein
MTSENVLSPAAIRMRRTRERRRAGAVCFQLELHATAIDGLIALGWLAADDRSSLPAVADAFIRFASKALALRVTAGFQYQYARAYCRAMS